MNLNNNFLEEEVEYVEDESATDEVIEEIVEEVEEEVHDAEQTATVLNKAMERIEQANLYKALLDHQLFAPGSARPEIISLVRKEFKGFILSRLEILLGIKPDVAAAPVVQQTIVQSPFSEDEVQAIKSIAKRLIEKEKPVPTVQPVQPRTPQIQALQTQNAPVVQEVQAESSAQPQRRVVKRVVKRTVTAQSQAPAQAKAPAPEPAKKGGRRQKTNNTSVITGEDLGQASNPALPPVKMPSQAQMDMMNAKLADQNARGAAQQTQGVGLAIQKVLG